MTVCPCCKRPFPPSIAVQGRIRQRLVDLVAGRPDGITSSELMDLLYADDPNGGPENPVVVRSHVYQANKGLAQHGYTIKAHHPGSGARYKLVELRIPQEPTSCRPSPT